MTVQENHASSNAWQALLAEQQKAAPSTPLPEAAGEPLALGAAWMLVLMFFLLPVLGAPEAAPVGDSVKSAIVAFGALGGLLWFALQRRTHPAPLQSHWFLALGVLLTLYSVGSIFWAHAYLATGEALRWALLSLVFWLTLQFKTRSFFVALSWAIHLGVFLSSVVVACQYWFGVEWFAQAAQPASTFVNRNFFSEYAVCALPFSLMLLSRLRAGFPLYFLVVSLAVDVAAFLMTGTRSALLGVGVALVAVPMMFWFYRHPLGLTQRWQASTAGTVVLLFLAVVVALGLLPTGNPSILKDHAVSGRGHSAFAHAFQRFESTGEAQTANDKSSISVRFDMWRAALKAVAANPIIGVGAGTWEVVIPLYQTEKSEIEIDYYVHNEFLQLIVEYGLVGWAFVLALLALLAQSAWQLLRSVTSSEDSNLAMRLTGVLSLVLLLWVSNLGFPWHLAGTGAFLALNMALMLAPSKSVAETPIVGPWQAVWPWATAVLAVLGLLATVYGTRQAFIAEDRYMRSIGLLKAAKLLPNPSDPRRKTYMELSLKAGKEAVAINPHYRKLLSQVADEFSNLGDWRNAVWAYELMAASRPNVPVIWANLATGYSYDADHDKAKDALAKAAALKPDAYSVRYATVLVQANAGDVEGAAKKLRSYIEDGGFNVPLVDATLIMARRTGDWDLALKALEGGRVKAPDQAVRMSLQMAAVYNLLKQPEKVVLAFRDALVFGAKKGQQSAVLQRIPPELREQVQALAQAQIKADQAAGKP
ncbi:O-antigen ligase family protein [Curvibacter sp. HBC28]|uniref:O-antigen ligase family protein n=1 Tax=Curvibacter microcysteis TaxID=3026419 RepID=A0ABT5MA39_9BURK|nr:O-antigen ligase family protein [Curvibacter sp. HBC28]MDD0813455.1 O-antigen ligase family protein [Curvibacter sp. HBC28]